MLAFGAVLVASFFIYRQLDSDFLPAFDEGGFVIDFWAPPGTSLTETSRQLDEAEKILSANPDVEGYSRRLGAEMGMFVTEAYRGDFAVKLKRNRKHSTDEVIAELRHTYNEQFPAFRWDFPGILTDVIGDLQLTPDPVEIKIFSPDLKWLEQTAPRVEEEIKKISGIVDTFDGLTETGPSINFRVRPADAARFGLSVQDIAEAVNTAQLGQTASYVLEGDRIVNIRVLAEPKSVNQISALRELPLRAANGTVVRLAQVADVNEEASEVELVRDDLRQDIIVSARLEGRDLGSAMKEIQGKLSQDKWLPPGTVEYGGLYQQQQESFRNLVMVLLAAILLVFTVLLIEFRSFNEPVAIVFGAILAMFGTVAALWLTWNHVEHRFIFGRNHRRRYRRQKWNPHARLRAAIGSGRRRTGRGIGAFRPSPFASGADDFSCGGAGNATACVGNRQRRGNVASAGRRRHRRTVHLRAAVARCDARGLLHTTNEKNFSRLTQE